MDSVQRQTGIVLSPAWKGAAHYLGSGCAASKATFRVSEKPGREPESPAARSCAFSSFPVSPWSPLSGHRFGLGGISRPWKVTLPLTELLPLGSAQGLPVPEQGDVLRTGPIHLPEGRALPCQGRGRQECRVPPCPLLRHCGHRTLNGAGGCPRGWRPAGSPALMRGTPGTGRGQSCLRSCTGACDAATGLVALVPCHPGGLGRRGGAACAAGWRARGSPDKPRWTRGCRRVVAPRASCGFSRGDASPLPGLRGHVAHWWRIWQTSA